jgi:hypothetical protein
VCQYSPTLKLLFDCVDTFEVNIQSVVDNVDGGATVTYTIGNKATGSKVQADDVVYALESADAQSTTTHATEVPAGNGTTTHTAIDGVHVTITVDADAMDLKDSTVQESNAYIEFSNPIIFALCSFNKKYMQRTNCADSINIVFTSVEDNGVGGSNVIYTAIDNQDGVQITAPTIVGSIEAAAVAADGVDGTQPSVLTSTTCTFASANCPTPRCFPPQGSDCTELSIQLRWTSKGTCCEEMCVWINCDSSTPNESTVAVETVDDDAVTKSGNADDATPISPETTKLAQLVPISSHIISVLGTTVADMGEGAAGRDTFTTSLINLLCTYDPVLMLRPNCKSTLMVDVTGVIGVIDETSGVSTTRVTYTIYDTEDDVLIQPQGVIDALDTATIDDTVHTIFYFEIHKTTSGDGDSTTAWTGDGSLHWGNTFTDVSNSDDRVGGTLTRGTTMIVFVVIAILVLGVCCLVICTNNQNSGDRSSPFLWAQKMPKAATYCNASNAFAIEVRAMPEIQCRSIGTIEPGEQVVVLAEHDDWYKIQMKPEWDDGSVPVVWAMKVTTDEGGGPQEMLVRVASLPSNYHKTTSAINHADTSILVSPGFGPNTPMSPKFAPYAFASNTVTGQSPSANGNTRTNPLYQDATSQPRSAWSKRSASRSPSVSPPGFAPPIYTPRGQIKSSTIVMTPRPDYASPQPTVVTTGLGEPHFGKTSTPPMLSGLNLMSPVPKMNSTPKPKGKMTAASPLRQVINSPRFDYQFDSPNLRTASVGDGAERMPTFESPVTLQHHGQPDRWSTPAGNAAWTPGGSRSALDQVSEEAGSVPGFKLENTDPESFQAVMQHRITVAEHASSINLGVQPTNGTYTTSVTGVCLTPAPAGMSSLETVHDGSPPVTPSKTPVRRFASGSRLTMMSPC